MPDERKVAAQCVRENMSAGKIGESVAVGAAVGVAGGARAGLAGAFVGAAIGAVGAGVAEVGSQARATHICIESNRGGGGGSGGSGPRR